jgi:hypothetical protein
VRISVCACADRLRNIGVLQTTVAELVTDKKHQRKSCYCDEAPNSD